jgi:hypothetical protein
MTHPQKPDFVYRRNGRVHLNRRGRQFIRLLAAEVCASAVVMLETPCSEVVWRTLATHSIRQFSLHSPPPGRHRVPSHFNWSLPTISNTARGISSTSWFNYCLRYQQYQLIQLLPEVSAVPADSATAWGISSTSLFNYCLRYQQYQLTQLLPEVSAVPADSTTAWSISSTSWLSYCLRYQQYQPIQLLPEVSAVPPASTTKWPFLRAVPQHRTQKVYRCVSLRALRHAQLHRHAQLQHFDLKICTRFTRTIFLPSERRTKFCTHTNTGTIYRPYGYIFQRAGTV